MSVVEPLRALNLGKSMKFQLNLKQQRIVFSFRYKSATELCSLFSESPRGKRFTVLFSVNLLFN